MTNRIRTILTTLLISLFITSLFIAQDKPTVCFTFDDGSTRDILTYKNSEWVNMMLSALDKYDLQAAFYVAGKSMDSKEGREVLKKWDDAGHLIANHTYSHKNYNSEKTSYEFYSDDILQCDSLINGYYNFVKYFRTPYLKRGDTKAKRDSLISFLKRNGYKNGYVTIDASDWYYNSRLIKSLKKNPDTNIEAYGKVYIEHLLERAEYYDKLAYELLGRQVKHSLLLHNNLTSALFLDDLIRAFHAKGWETIDAGEALQDEVYDMIPDIVPAGESVIWGLAKETGRYDDELRYPGEDSQFEEKRLRDAGLE